MLYREYTTTQVLVMEYIDGIGVDEKEKLLEAAMIWMRLDLKWQTTM